MTNEERDEILARLDQWRGDFNTRDIVDKVVINKRLDSHAADIKSLREWRNYLAGAIAALGGLVGLNK